MYKLLLIALVGLAWACGSLAQDTYLGKQSAGFERIT
jgi:hypothetical protein